MTSPFIVHETSLAPGTMLLEASAGTGKTWSLTSVAVRLLVEEQVRSVDRMLMVTFTRAATDELRHRLRARLVEAEQVLKGRRVPDGDAFLTWLLETRGSDDDALARLSRARRDVDQARVRTIHGFCLEVLAEGAFEAGLPLDGAQHSEGTELLRTALRDTCRAMVLSGGSCVAVAMAQAKLDPESEQLRKQLNTAKQRSRSRWQPSRTDLEYARKQVEQAIAKYDFRGIQDFLLAADPWWTAEAKRGPAWLLGCLTDGFDPDRLEDQEALFQLPKLLASDSRWLKKPGKEEVDRRALATGFAPVAEALQVLCETVEQVTLRSTLERYDRLKEELALTDHDDLIASTRMHLMDSEGGESLARRIALQFDAALVDEFQDTDADQWDVFRRIFADRHEGIPKPLLLLVGDPKQAIYGFRGADIFAYLDARSTVDRTATLTHNFRSNAALTGAVNATFGRLRGESFALADLPFSPVQAGRPARVEDPDAPLEIVRVDVGKVKSGAAAEAPVLACLVADIVARRKEIGEHVDLAVLVHRHAQARAVMRALRAANIDAVLARGGDIHNSEAMADWRVLLRALLDPSDLRAQRRARATRLWGAPLSQMGLEETGRTADLLRAEVELFARLRNAWTDRGVAVMGGELLRERETVTRWLGEERGERMVTDLRHSLELLNEIETSRDLGPEALLRWAESEHQREGDPEERTLRLERQSDAVQIVTSFSSKGLQYDTVYLPFAWTARPLPESPPLFAHLGGETVLDFSDTDPGMVAQATLEEVASRLRLHYVELTRARERCVVYLALVEGSHERLSSTPAAFLLGRPGGDAPEERGTWAQEELAKLRADPAGALDHISSVAIGAEGTAFRTAAPAASDPVSWPAPKMVAPVRIDFPPERRRALVPWRSLSYSALVHRLHDALALDPVEPDPVLTDRADPADAPLSRGADGIFGFARGARAGICLHELLEHSAFDRPVDEKDTERVQALLRRHALFAGSSHPGSIDPVQTCLDLVERVRTEKLPFNTGLFSELRESDRLDEWEFRLPIAGLSPAAISKLVARHWTDEAWVESATRRLQRLPSARLEGMLGGFVDLLFVVDGCWTILDWKSNDLGPDASRYTAAAMQHAMIEHDYLVQVLFYTLAVHRFLRLRVPDYDYERHVAGVSYVFLRGLCGDPQRGWMNLRPPRALIDALDQLFAGGGV